MKPLAHVRRIGTECGSRLERRRAVAAVRGVLQHRAVGMPALLHSGAVIINAHDRIRRGGQIRPASALATERKFAVAWC